MNSRLKKIRLSLGLSQQELGNVLGVSKGHVSMMESGTREVTKGHLFTLANRYNVSADYLETGNGDMFTSELVQFEMEKSSAVKVFMIDIEAEAGTLDVFDRDINASSGLFNIPGLPNRSEPYIAIKVRGDSMEPKFRTGDLVICQQIHSMTEFIPELPYLIITKNQALLKIARLVDNKHNENYGLLELESLNPLYRTTFIDLSDSSLNSSVKICRVRCTIKYEF